MDKVVPQRLREKVFLFLDDLLVVSPKFEEHIKPPREVSQCLRGSGLTIGLKKAHFCFKELQVEAIKNMPVPRSTKKVRRFLGTAEWCRRFIRNFAELAEVRNDERSEAALITALVLRHPDF